MHVLNKTLHFLAESSFSDELSIILSKILARGNAFHLRIHVFAIRNSCSSLEMHIKLLEKLACSVLVLPMVLKGSNRRVDEVLVDRRRCCALLFPQEAREILDAVSIAVFSIHPAHGEAVIHNLFSCNLP